MRFAATVLLALLVPQLVSAQETRGNISGTVTDSQAGIVPGASVTVTNTGTGSISRLETNANGYYEAPLLLPGNYSITIEQPGFKKLLRSGVTLGLGEQLQINIQLEVGAAAESVTVTAEAPMLDTNSASSGRAMTHREVMDLPVIGNNIMAITRMAPGVQVPGTTQFLVQGQVGGGSAYNSPGNVGGNEWSIDGASTNGTDRRAPYMPSPDVIDEFKIETSNFDASFGHSTGLSISMSTKSGANQLHGTGTYQYFNQRWNAASFFVKQSRYAADRRRPRGRKFRTWQTPWQTRPMLPPGHTNNFHGTVSGPVYIPKLLDGRNKLFFFLGFSELQEPSIRPAQRDQLHGPDRGDAHRRLLAAFADRSGSLPGLRSGNHASRPGARRTFCPRPFPGQYHSPQPDHKSALQLLYTADAAAQQRPRRSHKGADQ